METPRPMLHLTDIHRAYRIGPVTTEILRGVDLAVGAGDLMSIMGPSGSGKTTLMNIVGLLDRPTSGRYVIDGRDVSKLADDALSTLRNAHIGFVFQSFQLLPRLTAVENVSLPLVYRGTGRAEMRRRAREVLERVGMSERADYRPDQLSGGQKQRVAIARALVGEPAVVLAEAIRHLFVVRKLRGNRDHYHDPRNSFLNDVLDRGLGIPLTLAVVLLEVGWRLDLPMEGVNFPGHFLVRYSRQAVEFLIDPFHGGKIRLREEAQKILDRQHGGIVRLDEHHLNTASKRDMIVRLLLNLKGIYQRSGDHERALSVVERILIVRPTAPSQIRDRGYLLARLGRPDEAVTQLETYLTFAPGARDVDRVEALVRELKTDGKPSGAQ